MTQVLEDLCLDLLFAPPLKVRHELIDQLVGGIFAQLLGGGASLSRKEVYFTV